MYQYSNSAERLARKARKNPDTVITIIAKHEKC